ncbi:MAG TPA: FIST N-terminal domain-containing protein [Thermoanaerobaculia bacterium]|nr:FIST N-terminal domain-containing protein [Thermoanaerobaculia bacterium]
MRSRTLNLPPGALPRKMLDASSAEAGRAPDLVLGFLPPEDGLSDILAILAEAWPASLRFGCEAVTQFADCDMTTRGSLQLFWFDHPGHYALVEVVTGSHDEPPAPEVVADLAERLSASDGALLIVDGLRFPAERFLNDLRGRLPEGRTPLVAGGLASQELPVAGIGARVFFQERIYSAACLAVAFHGVQMRVEVVRGWSPASPVYTVTRAEDNVVHEIDGEAAVEWYRRFFTVAGELAPMPDSAWRFPLLIEGPAPERQGLYRSMRAFDDPPGAVTYWGSVHTGDRVRLGIGNDRSLVHTASQLTAGKVPEAAILYSCVGREVVLGEMAPDEVSSIHRALGGAALSGFFTFGEIGPTPRGGLAFYNQTAILVLLSEERA